MGKCLTRTTLVGIRQWLLYHGEKEMSDINQNIEIDEVTNN